MKNNQYFIDITNIVHKLLDALATSRFIFIQEAQLSKMIIWLLFVIFFQTRKEKKIDIQSQAIVLDLLNYNSTCHFNNFHANIIHLTLTFLSVEPTIERAPFSSSLIISLCVIPINIETRTGSCNLTRTKFPLLRSLNKVYARVGFKFLGPQ